MALVLRIEGRKLGQVAQAAFNLMESGSATMFVPAMVFAETLYLSAKARIAIGLTDVSNYLAQHPNCKQHPLDLAVVQAAARITDVPELHDRLIAGTALFRNCSLITNDPVIQASAWVTTVW
jgi:predicted nucleic acid-binding protein